MDSREGSGVVSASLQALVLAVHEADETTESRDDQDLAWLAEASAALSPAAVRLLYV